MSLSLLYFDIKCEMNPAFLFTWCLLLPTSGSVCRARERAAQVQNRVTEQELLIRPRKDGATCAVIFPEAFEQLGVQGRQGGWPLGRCTCALWLEKFGFGVGPDPCSQLLLLSPAKSLSLGALVFSSAIRRLFSHALLSRSSRMQGEAECRSHVCLIFPLESPGSSPRPGR